MNAFARQWETMTARERIVAMSLVTGGAVAIVNSTIWAAATCFMVHQKARVQIAVAHEEAYMRLGREEAAATTSPPMTQDDANDADDISPDSVTMRKR